MMILTVININSPRRLERLLRDLRLGQPVPHQEPAKQQVHILLYTRIHTYRAQPVVLEVAPRRLRLADVRPEVPDVE